MSREMNTFLSTSASTMVTKGGTMDQNPYCIPKTSNYQIDVIFPLGQELGLSSDRAAQIPLDDLAVPSRQAAAQEDVVDAHGGQCGLLKGGLIWPPAPGRR